MTREETLCEILRAVISAEPHNEAMAIAATKSFQAAMAEWDGHAAACASEGDAAACGCRTTAETVRP